MMARTMQALIVIITGLGFLASIGGHIWVKLFMRPGADTDFDDYYYEVEDRHPGLARYQKWSQITLAAAVIFALLLFVSTFVL